MAGWMKNSAHWNRMPTGVKHDELLTMFRRNRLLQRSSITKKFRRTKKAEEKKFELVGCGVATACVGWCRLMFYSFSTSWYFICFSFPLLIAHFSFRLIKLLDEVDDDSAQGAVKKDLFFFISSDLLLKGNNWILIDEKMIDQEFSFSSRKCESNPVIVLREQSGMYKLRLRYEWGKLMDFGF